MGSFGDSWRLTKTAFRMIREDKALLAIPAVAAGAYILILALFAMGFIGILLFSPLSGTPLDLVLAVMGIAAYFLLWFVATYFTAALVGAATIKLNGGNPNVSDGLAVARANIGKIFVWSLFAGTVGLAIQMIAARFRGLPGLIIAAVAEGTWSVATYFIVPVLLYENMGVWGSLKTSASTYVHNFGRTFITNIVLGILVGLPIVGAIILGLIGFFELLGGAVLLGAVLVIAALTIGIVAILLAMAAEGILTAALYRYAKTGKLEGDLIHPTVVRTGSVPTAPRPLSQPLPSSARGG